MDPESGAPPSPQGGGGGRGGEAGGDAVSPSVMQALFKALVTRLTAIFEALAPKKDVGVENRFYFDPDEKVWKLSGGETEKEKREAEAIRFHTSRGLTNSLAPATTACDPTRGAGAAGDGYDLPPPPMGGAATQSLHAPTAGGFAMASLSHPVYAPQGFAVGDADGSVAGAAGLPPPTRPRPGPAGAPPQARTSPFGAAPPAAAPPRSSPFGAAPGPVLGAAAPLSSPFDAGAGPAGADAGGATLAPPVAAAPFGGAPGPLASPFQAGGPGATTALATPFQTFTQS